MFGSQPFSPLKAILTGIGVLLGVTLFLHALLCLSIIFYLR